jgi:hypothetical protein
VKRIYWIILFSLIIRTGYAQYSELGIQAGSMYYVGDLNPSHFKSNHLALGLLYRYSLNKRIAIRINFLYGNVEANDADNDDVFRKNRNLSFRSNIVELGGMVEFNYYSYAPADKDNRFTTYLFIGFNYFKMRPEAQLGDIWYELNTLSTEGQGLSGGPNNYRLDAFAVPLGLGLKYNLGERIALGLEYGIRFTFTDYLDDVSTTYFPLDELATQGQVSPVAAQLADRRLDRTAPVSTLEGEPTGLQRGDPSRKDWYGFAGISFSVRIGKRISTCATWD